MPKLTLRDLDEATLSRVKTAARRQKLSVSQLICKTLRTTYGAHTAFDGLDALAGSWTKEQAAEFNAAIAPFGEVDIGLWGTINPPRIS